MAGKYAGVVKDLPRMVTEESDYQTRVNQAKAQFLSEPYGSREILAVDLNLCKAEIHDLATMLSKVLSQIRVAPNASSTARLYASLRRQIDMIEEIKSELNLKLEAATQLMTQAYEEAGLTSQKLDDGESVSLGYEPYAQIIDREEFRLWCVGQGLERSMSLAWQTTNGLTKERLLAGEPEPPGVKAFVKVKPTWRKG